MTYEYELIEAPNQVFNTNIGENNIEVRVRTFRDITYVSLSVNGEPLISGVRATPNLDLFPASVNSVIGGTFRFVCSTDDYPHYTNFNTANCRLQFEET